MPIEARRLLVVAVSGARSTDGDACGVGSASYASIMVLVVAALMLVAFARE